MQLTALDLPFKGQRDYLHGTDMYQAIVRAIRDAESTALIGSFRMAIHKIARLQCQLLSSAPPLPSPRPQNTIVEFSFASADINLAGWIVETNAPVATRVPYPEEEIAKRCLINRRTIALNEPVAFLPIEVLVAMNKELHLSCLPSAVGKWYFTRLDLDRLLRPDDVPAFQLELGQNVSNRFTKSAIFVRDKSIGHIYFSLVGS